MAAVYGHIAIQLSSIVLPVLMQALEMVAEGDSEYEGKRWYYNLIHRMTQRNIPIDGNAFENAQRLLDFPIRQTLERVYDEKTAGGSDDE